MIRFGCWYALHSLSDIPTKLQGAIIGKLTTFVKYPAFKPLLIMRKTTFFIVAIFAAIQFSAQKPFKRNTLYGEILGNGPVLSVNYERQMKSVPGFGLHIGVGLGSSKPTFPLGAKYLFDIGKQRSFFEAGAGITIAEHEVWETNFNQLKRNSYSAGFIPSVGFRHHSPKGFMWRVNYTPVFHKYRTELLFFGVSVGWRI
jgi:hypothetical protein